MDEHAPPLSQRQVLSPTQLVAAARELLEHGFPLLWLEAELSNVVRAKSGHLYFTLKDIGAQVRCAMFRQRAMHVKFTPADGQRVLVRARVTLYEPRGDFQLQIEHMEESGDGALQRAFEELKQRLQDEGLFARKRALPTLPQRIAIVTSPSGAAVRDVLSVLRRRFPLIEVDIFPSLVQGREAPAALRNALQAADAAQNYDLILLTRGGGSLEDLWAFNDERLARAIFAAKAPVVSAVGHEIDHTIADFVADLRAPTPSAAAELIVPDRAELTRKLVNAQQSLRQHTQRLLERQSQRNDQAFQRLQVQHPAQILKAQRLRLDQVLRRLETRQLASIDGCRRDVQQSGLRLQHQHPRRALERMRERLSIGQRDLVMGISTHLRLRTEQLRNLARTLNALNPLATLDRGYAIAFDDQGKVLRQSDELSAGDRISLRLARGHVQALVQGTDSSG